MTPEPPGSPPPTLKSVAALAGVSVMTASLALRNSGRIREETRLRVQELSQRLGYKPNPFAASLVSLRSAGPHRYRGTLALLHCYSSAEGWRDSPTFRKIHAGLERRADELGYKVDAFWFADPDVSPERLRRTLVSRGIQGVILGFFDEAPGGAARLAGFDASAFAGVTIGRRIESPAMHVVSSDQYHDAGLAADQLRARGYRRIGLVLNEWVDAGLDHRFRGGFLARQAAWPSAERVPIFDAVSGAPRPPARQLAAFLKWIERRRVDAVLSLPAFTHHWLAAGGLRVPEDIGVAYLDRPHLPDEAPAAGVEQNSPQVGAGAIDLVVAQMQRNEHGVQPFQKCLLIRGRWADGWTVKEHALPAPAGGNT